MRGFRGSILALTLPVLCYMPFAGAQGPGGPAAGQPRRPLQGANPAAVVPQGLPGQPDWFPLAPDHEEYLNKILRFWEYQAGQVQRYRCNFQRWEYDPTVLPRTPDIPATIARGNIQYQAPDKGKFQVEVLWDVAIELQGNTTVPSIKDGKPQYAQRPEVVDDHWVCDGQSVFQFDGRNKQIIKRPLPPHMQGKQIADGPLPFLFGARMDVMKQRYWIRVLKPPREGCFLLEAVPKRREDAADFSVIHVVIDEKEFLPEALILSDRVGGKTTYAFRDREKNWNPLPEMLNLWHQSFYAPKPPKDWKMVEEPFQGDSAALPPPAAQRKPSAPPRQATGSAPPTGQRR